MSDEFDSPDLPDDALGRELRDRTPEPGPGYWATIDHRLDVAAVAPDTDAPATEPSVPSRDTAGAVARLRAMQTTSAHTPSLAQRLLGAAAVLLLALAGLAVVVSSSQDDGPVDGVTADVEESAEPSTASTLTSAPSTSSTAATIATTAVPSTTAPPTSVPATAVSSTTATIATTAVPPTTVPATAVSSTTVPSTTAPVTSAAPTTSSPTTAPAFVMPNVVGAASIDAAAAAVSAACGVDVIVFPSPAWNPGNPVAEGQILGSWPSAGATLVPGILGCTGTDGLTITVFYANESYCSGPDDPIGLGWCPIDGTPPTTAAPAVTTTTTTIQPYVATMPDVVGSASIDAAVALIEAACGARAPIFPSPAWDPAAPQADGTVIGSLPGSGGSVYVDQLGRCVADANGTTITLFVADQSYCAGPDDPIGLGWCPRNTGG